MSGRSPDEVMAIATLGAVKPHRLSFARILVRTMVNERWVVALREIDVDADGVGRVVYSIDARGHRLHFVIRSDDVLESARTGRLSESRFDGMGILLDGPLDPERVEREMTEIQKRSLGRGTHDSLGWTLCSRSSRSFGPVVDALAAGRRPDGEMLGGGAAYLLRNNGYYGNGRHGTRPWTSLPPGHPLDQPYFPEMISLYLWREFGFDLAEEMARKRSPDAVPLDLDVKRRLGVGNATGQGMSTFLVKWPHWMHVWNDIRERAEATVLDRSPTTDDRARLDTLLTRVSSGLRGLAPDGVFVDPGALAHDVDRRRHRASVSEPPVWRELAEWAETCLHPEAVTLLRAVLTEVHGELVDPLADRYRAGMAAAPAPPPAATVADLLTVLDRNYAWAKAFVAAPGHHERFFYRSEEHGEQRVGERHVDGGADNETFTAVAHAAVSLRRRLVGQPPDRLVARLLLDHPDQRFMAERVLATADLAYAEVRADVTHPSWTPGEAARFVLATFGMEHARAHTNRWIQGVFLAGAPVAEDVAAGRVLDWIHPQGVC